MMLAAATVLFYTSLVILGAVLVHVVKKEVRTIMNTKLQEALAAATAAITPLTSKLDALEAFVTEGVPKITAAAVADALAETDLEEEAAAGVVNDVLAKIQKEVDDVVLPAAEANTDESQPGPAGEETQAATDEG